MKSISVKLTLCALLLSSVIYSQTKKEKTVDAKRISTGMYESSKNEEALKYYQEAYDKGNAQDWKGAIKLYEKALKEDPKFVEAYDNIAVCYRRLGDFENAIKNYNKSLELYPNGAMAHQNLGLIYGIQKEYDKAINEYKEVQKINPEDPEGYYGLINIYLIKENYKEAIKSATKTLEIYEATNSPYIGDAQYFLGLSYYYDNDNKSAKIYIQQAKKSGVKIPEKLLAALEIK